VIRVPPKTRRSRSDAPLDDSVTCRIEAVLSVEARGQVAIPKDIRALANIGDGDKLALIKTDALSADVEDMLRPLLTGE